MGAPTHDGRRREVRQQGTSTGLVLFLYLLMAGCQSREPLRSIPEELQGTWVLVDEGADPRSFRISARDLLEEIQVHGVARHTQHHVAMGVYRVGDRLDVVTSRKPNYTAYRLHLSADGSLLIELEVPSSIAGEPNRVHEVGRFHLASDSGSPGTADSSALPRLASPADTDWGSVPSTVGMHE